MKEVLHKTLGYKLNGIFFEVQNRLGRVGREKQYADLLALLLETNKIKFEREKEIPFEFTEGKIKGNKVDFLIEGSIVVDLKAKNHITKDDYFQMKRYLNAAKLKLGIIVNFKRFPLEIKRILNSLGIK